MQDPKITIENPFKVGDFVQFYMSYNKDPATKEKKVGNVTQLLSQYCGVIPLGSKKELFFRLDELKRPGSNQTVQQPLFEMEAEQRSHHE